MPQVDFYLIKGNDPHKRRLAICHWIEKTFLMGHRIYVCTTSEDETRMLDNLLWTFRQTSFIPHEIHPHISEFSPIIISHTIDSDIPADILINLAEHVPSGWESFPHIVEHIDENEVVKQAGRVRYKYYRDSGCVLNTYSS